MLRFARLALALSAAGQVTRYTVTDLGAAGGARTPAYRSERVRSRKGR